MTTERPARPRVVAELVVVALGLGLFACARALSFEWLERRFGLDYEHGQILTIERTILVVLGFAVIFVARPIVGRWTARVGGGEALATCFRYGVAFLLSIAASEVGLRILKLPRRPEMGVPWGAGEKNPRYGWLFTASRSTVVETDGRLIHYDVNAEHDRARSIDDNSDPTLPSILFVGESITIGHGLPYEESLPALVGEALNLQVVDLGVDGYSSDQAFLRLLDTLPRFEHPIAVVTLFLPNLMVNRLEAVDHPRLVFDGDEVKVAPPGFFQSLRLTQAFRESFDFHAEWAIRTAGEIFQRTARLARERGARAVFVTPYLGCNWPRADGYLVDELLVRPGLTVVNPHFGFQGIPGDNHPDTASTRRLADAVIAALQTELAGR
jgi:hypothetical protein